ncbi:hypothetical protein F5Y00DRAFT_233047 [Daldinia vernicosa]|uniref:uncharacterized protein n=1 Tax=Daldinia vernicosa TaxID=114800 RepID=UPI002007CC43|nr:uncharacterized protein F5Y00DRAFT_233047 [Daldinia vernicosa]KAI0850297.1 hypothetical protein F5Y00DRAFT_233047 [Daldinia vernicosa]
MAAVQRSNYLPYLQQLLDTQGDTEGVAIESVCGICQENKLDISKSAREFTSSIEPPEEHLQLHRNFVDYLKHDIERTVVLACGHVFGDRCIRGLLAQGSDLVCPSCGFRMAYQGCGHAIAPALIQVEGNNPIRDTFPLTIPEGARDPQNCMECRWRHIRSHIRYALADECISCRQRTLAHVPLDAAGHRAHRDQHMSIGLRQSLDDILALVWPEFVTRETNSSLSKASAESERHQIHVSLLNAMVRSEMEDTIWYRTKAGRSTHLTKEQLRRHTRGMASIEQTLLGWLMDSTREQRRMW